MNIAVGTRAHWNKVKKYYPDYKFYHEQGAVPPVADKMLLLLGEYGDMPKVTCDDVRYMPEREYDKEIPKLLKIDGSKPRLKKVEFHLADHCNLNCDLCNHYCNLETEKKFPDFEKVKKDLLQLKNLYWGVGILSLVGGEPFLNPDLDKYCDMSRELFPEATIRLFTNGILLPHMKNLDKYLQAISKNEIELWITRYPITEKMMGAIERCLKGSGIKIRYTEEVTYFSKKLTEKPVNNKNLSYELCWEKGCHFLNDGKLYGCTVFGRIHKLNEVFGTKYPETGLDIYKYTDGWALNEKLEHAYPQCAYCSVDYEYCDWTHGHKVGADNWIVHNPKKNTLLMYCKNVCRKIKRRFD